jgi:hypothetical protein
MRNICPLSSCSGAVERFRACPSTGGRPSRPSAHNMCYVKSHGGAGNAGDCRSIASRLLSQTESIARLEVTTSVACVGQRAALRFWPVRQDEGHRFVEGQEWSGRVVLRRPNLEDATELLNLDWPKYLFSSHRVVRDRIRDEVAFRICGSTRIQRTGCRILGCGTSMSPRSVRLQVSMAGIASDRVQVRGRSRMLVRSRVGQEHLGSIRS